MYQHLVMVVEGPSKVKLHGGGKTAGREGGRLGTQDTEEERDRQPWNKIRFVQD